MGIELNGLDDPFSDFRWRSQPCGFFTDDFDQHIAPVLVSASGLDEWNSFACRGAAAPGDPFDLIFVGGNAADQPARNEQRADHAPAPAVVQVRIADSAALALPIQEC